MNGSSDRIESDLFFKVFEDGVQSFKLLWIFGKEADIKMFSFPAFQIPDQQIKLPVKSRLLFGVKTYFQFKISGPLISKINRVPVDQLIKNISGFDEVFGLHQFFQ